MNQHEIIMEALLRYHSYCVTQAIRKRTIGKPSFTLKEIQQKEKIAAAWKEKANEVSKLIIKMDDKSLLTPL